MKGNVSGYICNHGSLNRERDTASPRLCAMIRTQASDKEVNDVSSRHPLYCRHAGSDAMGCRRPTSGVFKLYASGTGHADDVPPIQGTMVTYVTCDVPCLVQFPYMGMYDDGC